MELIYHYLWKHRVFGYPLTTVDGQALVVRSPGRHNDDAGPDFSGAKILIAGQEWVGNVEIHVKASDWFLHGHDRDRAYDSVILHVVAVDDARIRRPDGSEIPQTVVTLPPEFHIAYRHLTADLREIRCASFIPMFPPMVKTDWLESLAVERLQMKAERLLDYRRQLDGDWEQAVFTAMARGLGFGLNALPFEMLAKSIPLKYIYHHADNLEQVEALLLGQAGLLDSSRHIFDDYYQMLCREYIFLARKYGLRPMRADLWKYSRSRPQNFPHRRIAMLATALHEGVQFAKGLEKAAGDIDALLEFFDWRLDGYWGRHYGFGDMGEERVMPRTLSVASKELLIINVAAPFYYAHARVSGNIEVGEKASNMLMLLNAERNSKTSCWRGCGLDPEDALQSQALIHLRDEYCDRNRCLDCRFGHYLLRHHARGRLFDWKRVEENTFIEIPD